MTERTLAVWCSGRRAGTLVDRPDGVAFAYDAAWTNAGPPLSQSLPKDGSFDVAASTAFFGGLLPEGLPRTQLARRLGASADNDFSLLAAVAGDTAGAITLTPGDEPPSPSSGDVSWLDDAQLAEVITELPQRPMHADDDGEYRLSLAGVQDKLPVVVSADGRVGLTRGQTPSTHILKTSIARFDDTIVNEAFCARLGLLLGLDVAAGEPRRLGDLEFLLVPRYDRVTMPSGVERLHQEDFCQALGISSTRKYEAEGGPSLADSFALLRKAATVPAQEIMSLVDQVALSYLVGNHDAHGKNFSLLYAQEGTRLAPAYDVLSTVAYHPTHRLTRKTAMKIGGEYRPDYLQSRHWDRMLDEAGLGVSAARRRLRRHAQAAPAAAMAVRETLARETWDAPVLERIQAVVEGRSGSLLEAVGGPGRRRQPG